MVAAYLALEPDVLLGGGAEYLLPAPAGRRKDGVDMIAAFRAKGHQVVRNTATFSRQLPQAGVVVRFYDASGVQCAMGTDVTGSGRQNVVANTPTRFLVFAAFTRLPDLSFPCVPPFTTTRIQAGVSNREAIPELQNELAVTYHWTDAEP